MPSIADIRTKALALVQNDAGKLTTSPDLTCDADLAILQAVKVYEQVRPRVRTAEVSGAATWDYNLSGGTPIVSDWQDGLSTVRSVAYPFDGTSRELNQLQPEDWAIVRLTVSGVDYIRLRFLASTPAASEKFLLEYTTTHTVTAGALSINPADYDVVAALAGSFMALQLAAIYAESTDGTIQADSVNRGTRVDYWRQIARDLKARYDAMVSGGQAVRPAHTVVDVDTEFPTLAPVRRFFHERR